MAGCRVLSCFQLVGRCADLEARMQAGRGPLEAGVCAGEETCFLFEWRRACERKERPFTTES